MYILIKPSLDIIGEYKFGGSTLLSNLNGSKYCELASKVMFLFFFYQRVKLQCHIKKYDLDSDSLVSKEEFLTVTQGFKGIDPNVLFERLDKNGLGFFLQTFLWEIMIQILQKRWHES